MRQLLLTPSAAANYRFGPKPGRKDRPACRNGSDADRCRRQRRRSWSPTTTPSDVQQSHVTSPRPGVPSTTSPSTTTASFIWEIGEFATTPARGRGFPRAARSPTTASSR